MEEGKGHPWPPVDMVLRAASEGAGAAPAAATPDAEPASGAPADNTVDPAAVAERVFRLMQRDLRLERERGQRVRGR